MAVPQRQPSRWGAARRQRVRAHLPHRARRLEAWPRNRGCPHGSRRLAPHHEGGARPRWWQHETKDRAGVEGL